MRMAMDNHVGCITRQEFLRLGGAEFMAVTDMNTKTADDNVDRFAQSWIPGVVRVAIDGVHRCNEGELVEDLVAAHVAGVEDELNVSKGRVHLGPQESMRIRNQPYPPDVSREVCALR